MSTHSFLAFLPSASLLFSFPFFALLSCPFSLPPPFRLFTISFFHSLTFSIICVNHFCSRLPHTRTLPRPLTPSIPSSRTLRLLRPLLFTLTLLFLPLLHRRGGDTGGGGGVDEEAAALPPQLGLEAALGLA